MNLFDLFNKFILIKIIKVNLDLNKINKFIKDKIKLSLNIDK